MLEIISKYPIAYLLAYTVIPCIESMERNSASDSIHSHSKGGFRRFIGQIQSQIERPEAGENDREPIAKKAARFTFTAGRCSSVGEALQLGLGMS